MEVGGFKCQFGVFMANIDNSLPSISSICQNKNKNNHQIQFPEKIIIKNADKADFQFQLILLIESHIFKWPIDKLAFTLDFFVFAN